jgi:hypothetical protein
MFYSPTTPNIVLALIRFISQASCLFEAKRWLFETNRVTLLEGVRGTQPSPAFGGIGGPPPKARISTNRLPHEESKHICIAITFNPIRNP